MSKTSDIVTSKIKSRKFLAYCIGMVSLLVAGFTKLIPSEDISGIFKVISLGYWGAQGSIDAIKALSGVIEKRNGKVEDTED